MLFLLLHLTTIKTSQRGLIKHYTTIADAVDIPMILYNVPGRTGLNISVDTVVELAKHKKYSSYERCYRQYCLCDGSFS